MNVHTPHFHRVGRVDDRRKRHGAAHAALTSLGVLAAITATGCTSFGPIPTEADLARITPGMTRDEVISRVGRPTWTFGVRQENLTIWNYRYNHNDCVIYQISVRPDGTVKDAAQGYDPICDGPGHLRL